MFLLVKVKEFKSPERKVAIPSLKNENKHEKVSQHFKKHRFTSRNSSTSILKINPPLTQEDKTEFDHKRSLNLSLETLQQLKKMELKKYQDLHTEVSPVCLFVCLRITIQVTKSRYLE